MAKKKFYQTLVEVILALGLIVVGGMHLTPDKAYGCIDRGIAMNCDQLSQYYGLPNGKCINEEFGNKVCRTGWIPLKDFLQGNIANNSNIKSDLVKVKANGKEWVCQTNEGLVESYTKCISNSNIEGYLGELV